MNEGLIDIFRHNAWAMGELLVVCRELTEEQLQATVVGTFGTIIETLQHIIAGEASYCRRLTGDEPDWYARAQGSPSLAELATFQDELNSRWEAFLSEPFDAERTFIIDWEDGYSRAVPAGVVLAQVPHHGSEHRSQIATILTSIGVTPPEWGAWEYAEKTGRAPVHIIYESTIHIPCG